MLRKIRTVFAAAVFVALTLSFVGIGVGWIALPAKWQLVPAVMGLNFAVIWIFVLLSLVLGRLYCSIICPLGIFQDIISHFGKKRRFSYKKAPDWIRYPILALFVVAMIVGVQTVIVILDPYSSYGRILQAAFSHSSWQLILAGVLTLAVIVPFAWFGGRMYCNSICPVGSFLSLLSRFSIYRVRIDESKCVGCGLCEKTCKASCIDSRSGKVDSSRCVDCFDCLDSCKTGALKYSGKSGKPSDREVDSGRRAFLSTAAIVGGSLALNAQELKPDGGFSEVLLKKAPERSARLVPPGAKGEKNFYDKCTGCQLCVAACPNDVLRASTDLEHLLQPKMEYDRGWCRPECTECSDVCPSGAILPVDPDRKPLIHIGFAKVDPDLCIVNRDGVECGNCARHCPSGAIRMVLKDKDDPKSLRIPTVLRDKCIGCGACEFLCPSRPVSAITVDGLPDHLES